MAELSILELYELIVVDDRYEPEWEKGTPAKEALFIRFGERSRSVARSQTFDAVDARQLVVDLDAEGNVLGLEIA